MHEKSIPNRPCRYRVGVHRSALAGPRKRRATSPAQLARDPRRHLLSLEERLPLAAFAPRLPSMAHGLDGLITNDKFCFTRRSRLKLRPKRRGYPPSKDVRRGGIDETQLDRSTHDGRPRRRHPSLGSGLPAPPPMGGLEGNPEGGGD